MAYDEGEPNMINLVLHPGEKVRIRLHGADGEFIFNFGPDHLTVISYLRHRSRPVHEEIFAIGDTNEFDDEVDALLDANERSDEENWADGAIADGMRRYDRSKP